MTIPGAPELIVILLIVILLFGVGRIAKVSKELGSGIRAFKQGLQGDDESEKTENNDTSATEDK